MQWSLDSWSLVQPKRQADSVSATEFARNGGTQRHIRPCTQATVASSSAAAQQCTLVRQQSEVAPKHVQWGSPVQTPPLTPSTSAFNAKSARYAAKKMRQRDTHRVRQAADAADHRLLDSAVELANYERYRIHTTVDPTATSPIFSFSAQAGHVDALRTLLDSGANLNVMAEEVVRREGFQ